MAFLFAAPHDDEVLLRERAHGVAAARTAPAQDGGELRALTAEHGCDVATAVTWLRLRAEPANAAFLDALERRPPAPRPAPRPVRIAIVPTMYHRERPELGGDGRLIAGIAARCGAAVEIVPTESLGTVDGNAEIIARHAARWDATPTWLVSLSKGSADVKRALALDPALGGRLRGWINLAGMPGGTLLAEPASRGPIGHAVLQGWLLLRGARAGMLAQMARSHPLSRAPVALPAAVEVVNVVPMPLSFHLRKPVDRSAAYLGAIGPNDGYVLLEDALVLPGRICPVWGADHYLRVPQLCDLLYRLVGHACGSAA